MGVTPAVNVVPCMSWANRTVTKRWSRFRGHPRYCGGGSFPNIPTPVYDVAFLKLAFSGGGLPPSTPDPETNCEPLTCKSHRVTVSWNGEASPTLRQSQQPEGLLRSGRALCFSKPIRQTLISRATCFTYRDDTSVSAYPRRSIPSCFPLTEVCVNHSSVVWNSSKWFRSHMALCEEQAKSTNTFWRDPKSAYKSRTRCCGTCLSCTPETINVGISIFATTAEFHPQTVTLGARLTPAPQVAPTGSDLVISDQTLSAAAESY